MSASLAQVNIAPSIRIEDTCRMVRDNVSICQMGIKRPAQNQRILDIAPDQLYMACCVFDPAYRHAMAHDSPLL